MNIKTHANLLIVAILLSTVIVISACQKQEKQDSNKAKNTTLASAISAGLDEQFASPSNQYKPLTWFHVMSGNMSKAGITKDLESLAEVGIGGALLFNVTQGIPIGDIKFNSDRHIDIIQHMAKESERLDLAFGVHNADGWTSSGGPWIKPEHSMKKLVWSEVVTTGGNISITLPTPESMHNYLEEVAVIAYPSLKADIRDASFVPTVTASSQNFDPKLINDRSENTNAVIKVDELSDTAMSFGDPKTDASFNTVGAPWIQFAYKDEFELKSIEGRFYDGRRLKFMLYTSEDGKHFSYHQSFSLRRPGKRVWAIDANVQPVKARYFRLIANQAFNVIEMSMSANHLINNYLGRTSIARTDYSKLGSIGEPSKNDIIDVNSVIDLSEKMDEKGNLNVILPDGDWTIMRFAYTTTGAVNIPASVEGTGLEVDKFSREAFDVHYGAYVTRVLDVSKEVAPNATQFVEIDSYEVGGQNWTHGYQALFEKEFAYKLTPYLPLFAGKFVESAAISEAVLWDTRDLNAKLIANNYYGYFTELAHKDGIKTYIEPYGFGPFNDVDAGSKADIPMGEFWLKRDKFKIAAAASAAHIYNKTIVSAEAFTAMSEHNWRFYPAMAKVDGDKGFAFGINEMVFHRFAHQANVHVMPGMTMNRWGAHFDRTQPWWKYAGKEWFHYMSRSQFMLRQGHAVADVLWYLGDASPTACPDRNHLVDILPAAINYDCLNSEVLKSGLSAENGRPILRNGSKYKWLNLTNIDTISLDSLTALFELSKQGVVMVGEKPTQLSNFRVNEETLTKFNAMIDFIWSQPTTYSQLDWQQIYEEHGFNLDLLIEQSPDAFYAHRKHENTDIYFLYNPSKNAQVFNLHFSVGNKIPELFNPVTGTITKSGIFSVDSKNLLNTQLHLNGHQSMFVVFRENANDIKSLTPSPELAVSLMQGLRVALNENNKITYHATKANSYALSNNSVITLNPNEALLVNNTWNVSFDEFYGHSNTYEFATLVDWAKHPEKAIRDYSGTALYKTSLEIDKMNVDKHKRILLDLGRVDVSATITINGNEIGTSWIPPHVIDISEYVEQGENELEILVANLWINRLIADESLPDTSNFQKAKVSNNPTTLMVDWYKENKPPPPTERITFTTQPFFKADDERVSSGLIGPVRVLFEEAKSE